MSLASPIPVAASWLLGDWYLNGAFAAVGQLSTSVGAAMAVPLL